ncbi:MAG: hypothetical protein AAB731_04760 [Patescibacteria group bacterium]
MANQNDNFLDKFQSLPEEAQDYFLDEKTADKMLKLGKDFKLSEEQKSALVDLAGDISVKSISIKDTLAEVEKLPGLSGEPAKKLALAFLGEYFLPLNEFYDNEVSKEIARLGGKIEKFSKERVLVREESAGDAAREALGEFGELALDENLKHRLEELIESRLRGVRSDTDFKNILMRSPKVGGMGLDEETAKKIIDTTAEKMRSVKIVSESSLPLDSRSERAQDARESERDFLKEQRREEKIPPRPPFQKGEETVPKPEPPKPSSAVKIELIKPPPPKPNSSPKKDESSKSIPPPVKLVAAPEVVPPEEARPPQVKKEVEKKSEEKILLVPPLSKGEDISEIRENPRNRKPEISEAELQREIEHIKHKVMSKAEGSPLGSESIPIDFKKIASDVIEKAQIKLVVPDGKIRLETILVARLKDIRDSNETRDILARDFSLGGIGMNAAAVDALMPLLDGEFKKIEERLKSEQEEKIAAVRRGEEEGRKKAAESSRADEQAAMDKRFQALVGGKKFPAGFGGGEVSSPENDAPEVKKIPLSASGGGPPLSKGEGGRSGEVSSSAAAGRPKVQDIRYSTKLVGPVEEIGALTLTDFRRLGKNPQEIVSKIRGKVEALKLDSIKKWQEGVAAWSGSEVNKLYLSLFGEAIRERKSIKEAASARDKRGEPSLNEEEINGIMELNKSLRF